MKFSVSENCSNQAQRRTDQHNFFLAHHGREIKDHNSSTMEALRSVGMSAALVAQDVHTFFGTLLVFLSLLSISPLSRISLEAAVTYAMYRTLLG